MSTRAIGDVLLVLAAVPACASVAMFGRVPWWRSPWGRVLMLDMAAVSVVLLLAVVRLIFGDAPWFDGLRVGAFAVVVVALWWRLVFIRRAYHEPIDPVPTPLIDPSYVPTPDSPPNTTP